MAKGSTAQGLIPVTFHYQQVSYDVTLPSSASLADVLPGIIDEMGFLTPQAASQGFRVIDSQGSEISTEANLDNQKISSGTQLHIVARGTGIDDRLYDDLVQAVGDTVEEHDAPWTAANTMSLAAVTSSMLLLTASFIVWNQAGLFWFLSGLGGGLLALGAAWVIARQERELASVMVHWAGAILTGCASGALSTELGWKLLALGVAVILSGGVGILTLKSPNTTRPGSTMAGLFLIGTMSLWGGISTIFLQQELVYLAGTTLAVTAIVMIMIPWIALAATPIRSFIPRTDAELAADRKVYSHQEVAEHTRFGRHVAISLRAGGIPIILISTASVVDGTWVSIGLTTSVGVALLLNTRFIHERVEVLLGILAGAGTLFVSIVSLAIGESGLVEPVMGILLLLAGIVLVLGILNRTYSPLAGRVADTISVIALLCIIPLTAVYVGLV